MAKASRRVQRPVPPGREAAGTAPAPKEGTARGSWARALCPGGILLLALLAYWPTLRGDFVYDDVSLVRDNRVITSLRNVPRIFTTDYWGTLERPDLSPGTNLYRPLVMISFALNYAVGGLQPLGYHAVNILLHAGVSLAVYGLGRRLRLSRETAGVAAALFAVHPLHTEAVAGIAGRAELLMALGVLLALAGYLRGGGVTRAGSLLAFALSLLAKEQAAVVPVLLVLAELATGAQSWRPAGVRAAGVRLLPYAGILGAYLLLRTWVLGTAAVPVTTLLENPLAHAALGPRLLTALAVAGRYLTLCLWPAPLSPDYSYNQFPLATSPLDGRVLLAVLLWGGLLALGLRSFTRGQRVVGFAVGFSVLTFLPASNLLLPIGTIMGERLFYLPSVGLCWLAGLGWQAARAWPAWPRLRPTAWAVGSLLLLAPLAQSLRYGRLWRDDLTLFTYAVRVAPESARMQYAAGNSLLASPDRKEEAISHLRRAVEIYSPYSRAWDALGRGYLETHRWDEAIAAFQKASTLAPDYPNPQNNIGLAYVALGRWDDAVAAFRRAVALRPGLAQVHRNLADVYEKKGWTEAALAQRAIELNPTDPLAWLNAGATFLRLDWPEEALAAFREAVRLGPNLPVAHLRLAQAYDSLDRPREAAAAYEALLQLRPNLPAVHRRLAELYATRLGDPALAEAHRRQAQGVAPRPAGP